MTQIHSLAEAEQLLARYIPPLKDITGKDITLERMVPLMQALGNPEKQLKIVHIAGTSGKTSTAYYMAALLGATGKKVGLTVSPHLDSVTERVQINLEPLPEKEFCQALGEFMGLISSANITPTYFELLMAFVYWYFAKSRVDYAVIETGLGGLHDASNVADNMDKVCIITDIGYDHMHVLGHELAEIARQKAGIIQSHNRLFTYEQSEEVMNAFKKRAAEQHAILNVLNENQERADMMIPETLDHLPTYQQHNWLLAYKTFEFISDRDNSATPHWEELLATMELQVPGRMDTRTVRGKTLIMDGAHNAQKMQAFVSSFQTLYPGKKAAILLGMKQGKEYEDVLPLLKPICSNLIISSFTITQDLPIEAIDLELLAEAATRDGFEHVLKESDLDKAYQHLLASPDGILIITGSFYLLAALRPTILGKAV